MSNWWDADPAASGLPDRAPLRISVGGRQPQAETFRSNPRGFSVQDVQAAVRGDAFNSPGLPIKYEAQPGQTFGVDATRNAQPIQNLVAHHTGGPTLEGAMTRARGGGPFGAGPNFGYHFYIDTDGTVVQGAPMDARTNHVQPPGAPQRTGRDDISNNNSVGVSFVGSGNPNDRQLAAAQNLSRSLMQRFGIQPQNVVGHGEIQSSRQAGEGMPLVNALRAGPAQEPVVAQAPSIPLQMGGTANAARPAPSRAAPAATNFWDADPVAPQAPTMSRGGAAALGAAQGVTANFGDELAGVVAASPVSNQFPTPFNVAGQGVMGLAALGYEYLTGGDAAAKRYAARRDEVRGLDKAAQEQYPGTYLAGNIAGAVASPAGKINAVTMPGRIAQAARTGAIYGGVSGAGEGTTIEDRASRGAIGTALGAVTGGGSVPVIEGGSRLIGAAVSRPVNMLNAAVNPQGAAERAVGRAYREAVETDPLARQRLSQNDLAASQAAGGPATVLDTLGGEGRNLARSAGNLSGGARDTLNRTLDERFETQAQRFTAWLNDRFSYPNAEAQQRAIDQVERTVNRAAYNRAYQAGDRPIWSPELELLVGSDVVQDAIRKSVSTGKDRAISQGYGGFNSPVTVTPDGRLMLRRGPGGQPTYPNLQFWDQVRREVSNEASKTRRAGADEDATRLGDLARQMNAALDNLVPSYQEARQGAARFFGAENALEAGQRFVTENFNNAQTRFALSRMSDVERRLFQDGFVSHYIDTLRHVPDRADVVRRIYNSPAAREKIEIALGRQRATEMEAMIRVETIMQQGLRAVQGNSTTAMQIAGLGMAGAGAGGFLGFDPTTSGLATALATAGKRGIDARVAQRVAELLTSNDPAVLNRGIRMLAGNHRMMEALRSIDAAGVKAGGSQVPSALPGVSVPAIGRAEGEPEVPRPPRQQQY